MSHETELSARLGAIVSASSDAIISYDLDGTIRTWNPAAERVFGYAAHEIVGRTVNCLVPPEHHPDWTELLVRGIAGETVRDVETVCAAKDGQWVAVSLNQTPVRGLDGSITGLAAAMCDITDRQRIEEQFRRLLESAPDAILGVDRDGRIVLVNMQTEQIFGYSRAELVGQPVELLVPDRFQAAHDAHRRRYAAAPTTRPMGAGRDLWARRRDGTEVPVEISLSPVEGTGSLSVVVVLRDTSDRRRLEEERARSRVEVAQLKDDLASMIVHDLRNPVNGIAMTAQLMLRRADELSERHRKNVRTIAGTCRELLRLIQNLLEISRIEAGKMPVVIEMASLAEVVAEVATDYGPVAEEAGKRLVLLVGPDVPPVRADLALLRRVLVNLVVNALRHSGSREVRIEAAPAGVDEVVIRVVDHGQGIPAERQERIFEKFGSLRGGAGGEPSTDTGLGLPFCKLAVEQMNGRITLSSNPGAATAFTVTLPAYT